jgi:hypothetical protein
MRGSIVQRRVGDDLEAEVFGTNGEPKKERRTVMGSIFKKVAETEEGASQRELFWLTKEFERLPREWQDALELGEEPLRPEIEPDFLGHGKDE